MAPLLIQLLGFNQYPLSFDSTFVWSMKKWRNLLFKTVLFCWISCVWLIINGMCLLLNSFLWKHSLGPCVYHARGLRCARGGTPAGKSWETASAKSAGCKGQGSGQAHGSRDPRLPLTPIQLRCGSSPSVELPELGQEEKEETAVPLEGARRAL